MSDDRFDNHRYHNEDTFSIQSTAGAVPMLNKKGEVSMQKVKVSRYVSGKRPEYARGTERDRSSESDSSDDEDFTQYGRQRHEHHDEDQDEFHTRPRATTPPRGSRWDQKTPALPKEDLSDPRIRRLMQAKMTIKGQEDRDEETGPASRHRYVHEAEVLSEDDEDEDGSKAPIGSRHRRVSVSSSDSSSSGDEELDEEAISRRRDLMRQRALAKAQIGIDQEEILDKEEEKSGSEEDDDDETSEEETDSEEEDAKLKPVFVRKKDRLTVQEREQEELKEKQAEREAQKMAERHRQDTLRLVETIVKESAVELKANASDPSGLNEVITDDENDEAEYEAWKLRELRRMRRDREEKETEDREREEMDRLRNMTEAERRQELKINPKQITNKSSKGKYKFMQKYYHRGAFFMAAEENLYKRDYSAATLEDKFDKTVLPKVMQVKNFGRSGRTKYTHLVDQDTTQFDAPWARETNQNLKFTLQHAGGMKEVFCKPSAKKKKYE